VREGLWFSLSRMSQARKLWEFLDTADPKPAMVDTADEGIEQDYFAPPVPEPPIRWRVAATAGIGLFLAIVVIAVGAYMFRTPALSVLSAGSAEETTVSTENYDAPGEPGVLLVHVVGAVESPGVVEVPINSRVIDAINQAGGATSEALLDGVNLARLVFDGEQIVVPVTGQEPAVSAGQSGQKISLSQADSLTLQTLPRVGPATAERIIAWRTAHGPFRSVEDLLAVSGIGPATVEGFRDLVVP